MQYSVSSGKWGVIQRATFLAFGDSQDHTTAWPLADMTASANEWVQRTSAWIWRATGLWEMDDSNKTDLPTATTTLVSAQQDYSLPTTNFKLKRVEVKDNAGNWSRLGQLEMREIDQALPEFYKTNGLPKYYRVYANSIFLYPAPDNNLSVTLASGMRIYFTRDFTTFSVPASYTTADTTAPGFDTSFHDIIPTGMAYDWCVTNGPEERRQSLEKRLATLKDELEQHYGVKDADKKVGIRPKFQIYL